MGLKMNRVAFPWEECVNMADSTAPGSQDTFDSCILLLNLDLDTQVTVDIIWGHFYLAWLRRGGEMTLSIVMQRLDMVPSVLQYRKHLVKNYLSANHHI